MQLITLLWIITVLVSHLDIFGQFLFSLGDESISLCGPYSYRLFFLRLNPGSLWVISKLALRSIYLFMKLSVLNFVQKEPSLPGDKVVNVMQRI